MNGDEQEFEEFLRAFEPRRPRSLPLVTSVRYEGRRLAAAAVVLMAIGASLWLGLRGFRTKSPDQHPAMTQVHRAVPMELRLTSSVGLTRAALEDQNQFGTRMNDIAPRTLPRFDRADGSLRTLAKE
jgi:hypothetical protein